ncbi:hypothetical protein SPD48_16805 [Pseudogracilibacillus sp. SE30717A]|uniref:hypothetical protein n=1 Tax=Pseudogracilibacillus sp. SE30717A TaxID=3098293 RepID=UPI00300E5952
MIQATLTIGAVLTVALLLVSIILVKVTPKKSYATYFPGFIFFAAGLILLLFATILDRIWIMGAGLGGWGIACLFAAVISLMVTAIFDTFRQEKTA